MGLAVLAATLVCLLGVVKGVERVTKVMMLTLLALLGILAVRSLTLPGAAEGLRFYLKPDWSQFLAHPGEVIFVALPQVFAQMAGGRFWGFLFFLFLACAALTTVIAVFECLIAGLMDSLGMKRLKATLLTGCGVALLSLPCVLWDGVLKWEDFAVSQLWLPLGALTQGFFVVNGRWGWGWENYRASVSAGTGWNLPAWIKYHYAVLIPILIATVLIAGLVTFDYR